jgi:hypothetical protein
MASSILTVIAFIFQLCSTVTSQDIPAPIVFEPSQQWFVRRFSRQMNLAKATIREGSDGPWGTFHLRVGTPPQIVRVLPGTASSVTLVVAPQGCTKDINFNCSLNTRGGQFASNESLTWEEFGTYNLGLNLNLGYEGVGNYGKDTVGLDLSTGQTTMGHQTVTQIATADFDLGFLGLSPRATSFENETQDLPAFFKSLQSTTRIAGQTWSYHAGAFNRESFK